MTIFDEDFQKWIETNLNIDVATLRLRHANAAPEIKEAISQIECRLKAGDKFSRCRSIGGNSSIVDRFCPPQWFPSPLSVEQATSLSVACFHASLIPKNCRLLDMTMGLGVDSATIATPNNIETTAIERDERLCQFARANYRNLNNFTIVNADSVDWLRNTSLTFDWIFIDPARRDNVGHRVYNIHDCTPDVAEILPLMLAHAPNILIKLSPMLDITATIADLKHVAKIYIVEEKGEVRELLVHINHDAIDDAESTNIVAVNESGRFEFNRMQEATATESYSEPIAGEYIYEPSPMIMKAGSFKLLCKRYNVGALHPNTHLYTSNCIIDEFPGKKYKIENVVPYSSKYIKRLAKDYPEASVSVRNFPLTASQLRAKLKVKESDVLKITGVTLKDGQRVLLIMNRI